MRRGRLGLIALTWIGAGMLIGCDGASGQGPGSREPAPLHVAPNSPLIQVTLFQDRRDYLKGAPVDLKLTYAGLPAQAGVDLFLVRDVEPEKTWPPSYQAPTGPIVIRPLAVSGSGSTNFQWDGKQIACAPFDGPTFCDGTDVGRYRIMARVYDRSDFSTVVRLRPPLKILGESYSSSFIVRGSPDFAPLEQEMRRAVVRRLKATNAPDELWRDGVVWPLAKARSPIEKRLAGYCIDFSAGQPFEGVLKACAPASVLGPEGLRVSASDVKVTGHTAWRPGVIRYGDATAAALNLAEKPYLTRAGTKTQTAAGVAYRDSRVEWAYYRPDLKAWVFWLVEVEAGSLSGKHDGFADWVVVRVSDDGKACHVLTVPAKDILPVDLERDAIGCA